MPEEKRKPQVFISYSRKDLAFVERLASDIKDAGLEVWYDLSDLKGGARWRIEIEKAIRGSQYLIVVLSPDSVASEWVEREYLFASDLRKKVIPLFYRQCNLSLNYLTLHYIDVQGTNYKRNKKEILRALGEKEELVKELRFKNIPDLRKVFHKLREQRFVKIISLVVIGIVLIGLGMPTLKRWFAPTPFVPTSTITPSSTPISECQMELADGIFKQILEEDLTLANDLGSVMMPTPTCIWSSYQPFEGGEMIWRSDILFPTDIYVLFSSGDWKSFKSDYKSGLPIKSCEIKPLEGNLLQPVLGFGKTWCDHQDIKELLGFAIVEEKPLYRPLLSFENGWLILINDTVYAMFNEENWKNIPSFKYKTITLQSVSELETPEGTLGLGQGIKELPEKSLWIWDPLLGKPLKVPFEIGWRVSTQCEHLPNRPAHIVIDSNIIHPLTVYFLLQAGWGLKEFDDQQIGKITLEFENDNSIDIPLILGVNIRDWADRPTEAVTQVSSFYSQLAWEGEDPDGVSGRMDILITDIPSEYRLLTLKRIHIWDESPKGEIDSCIHLLAVTVKYLP